MAAPATTGAWAPGPWPPRSSAAGGARSGASRATRSAAAWASSRRSWGQRAWRCPGRGRLVPSSPSRGTSGCAEGDARPAVQGDCR
eukprot:4231441-Pyramimonas_sp.AAC.1